MPCYDSRDHDTGNSSYYQRQLSEQQDKTARLEALLCGIMTVMDATGRTTDLILAMDWEEVGLQEAELIHWWETHKSKDRRRKEKD